MVVSWGLFCDGVDCAEDEDEKAEGDEEGEDVWEDVHLMIFWWIVERMIEPLARRMSGGRVRNTSRDKSVRHFLIPPREWIVSASARGVGPNRDSRRVCVVLIAFWRLASISSKLQCCVLASVGRQERARAQWVGAGVCERREREIEIFTLHAFSCFVMVWS